MGGAMNGFWRLFTISGIVCIGLGVALALAMIAGIWFDFQSQAI
jgi:hypothetical protein